ncbi:MAG: polysaccharide deacetylase family protein [Gammaproteobacteria bacterium]
MPYQQRMPMISTFAIKHILARAIGACSNLDARLIRSRQRYIICYHRIIPEQVARAEHSHDTLWVTPKTFEEQVHWMQRIGEIVPYERILDMSTPNDRPLFVITFDDGWKDNYDYAFPILKKYRAPAIIFLVTAAIDTGELFWPEDVVTKTQRVIDAGDSERVKAALSLLCPPGCHLDPDKPLADQAEICVEALKLLTDMERKHRIAAYHDVIGMQQAPLQGYILTWDQIREMQADGIAFGSHTHTHRILKYASPEKIEEELIRSRDIISSEVGKPVEAFAYPNARYNGNEGEILARCGYRYAFRLHNLSLCHHSDPYYIPRIIGYEAITRNPHFFKLQLLEAPFF